jgi:hypothetical protein
MLPSLRVEGLTTAKKTRRPSTLGGVFFELTQHFLNL